VRTKAKSSNFSKKFGETLSFFRLADFLRNTYCLLCVNFLNSGKWVRVNLFMFPSSCNQFSCLFSCFCGGASFVVKLAQFVLSGHHHPLKENHRNHPDSSTKTQPVGCVWKKRRKRHKVCKAFAFSIQQDKQKMKCEASKPRQIFQLTGDRKKENRWKRMRKSRKKGCFLGTLRALAFVLTNSGVISFMCAYLTVFK